MFRFILKRILWMIPVLFVVIFIVFTICHYMPGDPVEIALAGDYTQEQYDAMAARLGTDQPFFTQFFNYLKGLFKWDLGTSYQTGRSVNAELGNRVWTSVKLGILSCFLSMIIGIIFGIISAILQNTILDYIVSTIAIILAAIPGFWLALELMLFFCLHLRWLPATGLDSFKAYILPVVCCSSMSLAIITRMTRSSMLEVIRQDYIRTARSKGLSEGVVIIRHALKNALIPIITVIGTQFSIVIGGSIIVEQIFNIPGMGARLISGIMARDYSVVLSITVIICMFTMIIMLLVDIVYAIVDPRIKAQFIAKGKGQKKRTREA